MIHIGIDLHHKNSYVRAIDDLGHVFSGQRVYHTDIDKLWQYLGQFGDELKRVVFEATANARWMERLLKADKTIEPVAVTPHKVRIIAETVAKTDKIDATVLATLSKLDALPRSWLPDEDVEQLSLVENMERPAFIEKVAICDILSQARSVNWPPVIADYSLVGNSAAFKERNRS